VLPVSVIVACDCIFVIPRSQLATVETLLPLTLISCFEHIPEAIPVDTVYISRCTDSSRHIVVRRGLASALPLVMWTSQRPGLSLGNSSAAATAVAAASSPVTKVMLIEKRMGVGPFR
jgi:hypothetical protein